MKITTICVLSVLAASTVPATADVTIEDITQISLSVFVQCAAGGTGEVVDLSGPLHTVVSFTINGNNIIGYSHSQPQGICGIGETTGAKYQATGASPLPGPADVWKWKSNWFTPAAALSSMLKARSEKCDQLPPTLDMARTGSGWVMQRLLSESSPIAAPSR